MSKEEQINRGLLKLRHAANYLQAFHGSADRDAVKLIIELMWLVTGLF